MSKKISIVTGGAGGLGLEIAEILVRSGKNVLILGRNKDKLKIAVSRLLKSTSENSVRTIACNIGDEADIRKTGQFITTNGYVVEYLFNNAGSGLIADAGKSTGELFERVMEANLRGMILLTGEILRITPVEEELTIVNIMSTSALAGRSGESIYCSAKFGARGYTEALRSEFKGTKRNIIGVYPGGMRTDFWKMPGHDRDISKFMDPAEVADKIVKAVLVTDKMVVSDITINR